jgi:aminoglycoside 3-N-acetyltransferase
MGQIVEAFRTWPDVRRSRHPAVSFSAWGRDADRVVSDHALPDSLGEGSPLARLYELGGRVLLLGVDYESCTCLHLAQYRAPGARRVGNGAPVREGGARVWKVYEDIELDTDEFAAIGAAFERDGDARLGPIGSAHSRLFAIRDAVDFAVNWFTSRSTPPT